jgi:hypothetical protein
VRAGRVRRSLAILGFSLALQSLLALDAVVEAGRQVQNACELMPAGAVELITPETSGTGLLSGCNGTYADHEIRIKLALYTERLSEQWLKLLAPPDQHPTGATVRPASGLGEAAQEGLVSGPDSTPRWYMLYVIRGCYLVEAATPARGFDAPPQPQPVPMAEVRRLVGQLDQRLASLPPCGGGSAAAPKAPAAPAAPAPAAAPPAPPAAAKAPPPAATPAPAAKGETIRVEDLLPRPAAIGATLNQPLTGQPAPALPSPDDLKRGAAVGTAVLWLSVVLNIVDRLIGLGGPLPPAGVRSGRR